MKCDLCGYNHAHISTMKDIVHNRTVNRQVVVCPECGFRRNLQECHSERDALKRDTSMQDIERRKEASYRRMERGKPTLSVGFPSSVGKPSVSTSSYAPAKPKVSPAPKGKEQKQTNPLGCLLAIIALLVALVKLFTN